MSAETEKNDRMSIERMASLKNWGDPPDAMTENLKKQVVVDCGWGRLLFGQTFNSNTELANQLRKETPGQRDVGLYIRDPQVVISKAPQELFIDPSLTFRLDLGGSIPNDRVPDGLEIYPLRSAEDKYHINRIFKARGMVPQRSDFYNDCTLDPAIETLVAVDRKNQTIVGTVTGVDHYVAFEDPDNGSSLWALAVDPQARLNILEVIREVADAGTTVLYDPQCRLPAVGKSLVETLAQYFKASGRSFMDLSVMHDNEEAIQLYKALGFYQVPVYCIKNKNAINEPLYVGSKLHEDLNIYSQIIVNEAYRRGIAVEIIDAAGGYFDLSLGGRTISCRESLTDLTSAVSMSRCDDKEITHRFLQREGINVPVQMKLDDTQEALAFLEAHKRIVIKPAQGEQGAGVSVDLKLEDEVSSAYGIASRLCDKVIGEQYVEGQDLRIIVIDQKVVAAAIRKPATIVGDGSFTISELIHKQSRRRKAATQGESEIPMDSETRRCIQDAGYSMADVLPKSVELHVRKTANLHTGGTLHDVTAELHPALIDASVRASMALDMPLVGLDLIVEDPTRPDYIIIEANERPGLANHEPQPTAERLIDMLFPQTLTEQNSQ